MRRFWTTFLAWTRLSPAAVCEASKGSADFHDYPDSITPEPWHFYPHVCRRCGKTFGI